MLNLSIFTTLLLDMDGVLYRGDNPLPGVNELLALWADVVKRSRMIVRYGERVVTLKPEEASAWRDLATKN